MIYYFLRLDTPRPTFGLDMTAQEREVMHRHVAYWTDLMRQGVAQVFGPVLDPAGAYGVGIIGVEHEAERDAIIARDPANGLHRYSFYPMKAIVPGATGQVPGSEN